jgi:hypothetical protein
LDLWLPAINYQLWTLNLLLPQAPGEEPEAGEGGQEDREAGRVMPFSYRLDPDIRGARGEEKQGAHEHGLEGADAAAGFINTNHTGADLDDIAVLGGQYVQPAEEGGGETGHGPHQALSQGVFDPVGPGDGHQDEADGEGEVTEPWTTDGA